MYLQHQQQPEFLVKATKYVNKDAILAKKNSFFLYIQKSKMLSNYRLWTCYVAQSKIWHKLWIGHQWTTLQILFLRIAELDENTGIKYRANESLLSENNDLNRNI